MRLLDGRVAIVTGGGGEIGGAAARLLAREGARVAVADIRKAAADHVADAIRAEGGTAIAIEANSAIQPAAERIVAETVAAFGRLTTYVNTPAALTPDSLVEDMAFEDWNQALAVNLSAAFLMCKYAVPHIRAAG